MKNKKYKRTIEDIEREDAWEASRKERLSNTKIVPTCPVGESVNYRYLMSKTSEGKLAWFSTYSIENEQFDAKGRSVNYKTYKNIES
jgi:hypothetical protein